MIDKTDSNQFKLDATGMAPRLLKKAIFGGMLLLLSLSPGFIMAAGESMPGHQASARTPLPGTVERRAILDALRAEILRLHKLKVIFVVAHLKVRDGWAWVQTRPQSKDGVNHYEDVAALLRKEGGAWGVVELSSGDNGTARRRFPDAPAAIFPPP